MNVKWNINYALNSKNGVNCRTNNYPFLFVYVCVYYQPTNKQQCHAT